MTTIESVEKAAAQVLSRETSAHIVSVGFFDDGSGLSAYVPEESDADALVAWAKRAGWQAARQYESDVDLFSVTVNMKPSKLDTGAARYVAYALSHPNY